uniref:AlNc14C173G8055 protein n=1 Tax=Albugo laibachii Nc14 TaxID=890382 RepID=F0WNN4_9STRA|nr:AlNc14C173G8055 [Albugo laibachii Nc14]|eukprot:CCA22925.1 AlNc14C173G8055 [Albugo laibachii Nc14]
MGVEIPHLWTTCNAQPDLLLFELMLICTEPKLFTSDHWIQYLTGQLVIWIPAHYGRLLTANVVIPVLPSPLGNLILSEWVDAHWDTQLFDDLSVLDMSTGFLHKVASILQLTEVAGVQTLVAGSLGAYY